MGNLPEHALREKLRSGGFDPTLLWQDRPNAFDPDHAHNTMTAHIILEGEMQLTMNGNSEIIRSGDRCDPPPRSSPLGENGSAGLPLPGG
jgi:mannose-6-phosphate isomerase-like protein (cupin superfamily)